MQPGPGMAGNAVPYLPIHGQAAVRRGGLCRRRGPAVVIMEKREQIMSALFKNLTFLLLTQSEIILFTGLENLDW